MPRNAPTPRIGLEDLRRMLAERGIPLFQPTPPGGAPESGLPLSNLIVALASSGDARLVASIPCLLAMHDGEAGRRAVEEAAAANPGVGSRLGFLYRLTRALVISRAPDLERLFGRRPSLEPSALEPDDLPDPSESHGERTPYVAAARACAAHAPDVAGGVEHVFDQWLRLVSVERRRVRA